MNQRRPIVNVVGDLVLREPRAPRAAADPAQLRLFETLRREGPLSQATKRRDVSLGPAAIPTAAVPTSSD